MSDLSKMSIEELCSEYTKTYYTNRGKAIIAEIERRTRVPNEAHWTGDHATGWNDCLARIKEMRDE